MIHRPSLQERVELARQNEFVSKDELKRLIDDLWREVERLRRHYQER